MFTKMKKIAISTLVGIGVLAAIPATANANHRHNGGVGIEFHFGSNGHSHWRRHGGHTNWKRGGHHRKRHGFQRFCTNERALNKAYRMGVHRPHIRHANNHVIKVKGRSHGHRVRIVFSRAPGCPVISY